MALLPDENRKRSGSDADFLRHGRGVQRDIRLEMALAKLLGYLVCVG